MKIITIHQNLVMQVWETEQVVDPVALLNVAAFRLRYENVNFWSLMKIFLSQFLKKIEMKHKNNVLAN